MKTLLLYTTSLAFIITGIAGPVRAQQVSNPADNKPVTDVTAPQFSPYYELTTLLGVNKYNYVRTQVPDAPSATWPPASGMYRQITEYADGLGRTMQTVAKNAHADSFDLISQKVYDAGTGRETYQYLPFTIPVSQSFGLLSETPNSRIRRFYDAAGFDEQPFSKAEREDSPLGRVKKSLAPGRSWVGSGRGQTFDYFGSIAAEGVRIFTIGSNAGDLPVTTATYAGNQLWSDIVTDEDGKKCIEYKNKKGQLVLKKTRVSGSGIAHDGFVCTYFVYDDLQKLRYVIPPKAVAAISTTWNVSTVTDLCYSYYYDTKGRLIEKRVPGKGADEYVYDKRDRQVFYRDGNLKDKGKWAFTIYDAYDRPICSGLCGSNEGRGAIQGYLDDNFSYASPNLLFYQKNYSLYNVYPTQLTNATPLSYTFYDTYQPGGSNIGQQLPYDASQFSGIGLPVDGTVVPSNMSNHIRGLATGSRVRVTDPEDPNSESWLTTVSYYDDKGRTIQSLSENLAGGVDISSNIYYFQGMLWKNILRHQNPNAQQIAGTSDNAHTSFKLYTTNTLDLRQAGGSGLVKSISQKIDDGIEYQFGNYFYDHMNRNVVRQTPAANFLNTYNMRGFLNLIDVKNTFEDPALSNHVFEEKLFYDKGFASKLYNGNIAGITWRKYGNTAAEEAYGYSYDPLDRLTHAEYARKNTSGNWVKTAYDYTASNITYDLNGNIQSMNQRGINPPLINSPIPMDQLSYTYAANSNQLIKVVDAVSAASTQSLPDFKDNNNQASVEYFYDDNGNLEKDDNKGITSITYSPLNKPEIITTTQGFIAYTYDANGNRLRKKVHTNATSSDDIYDYIGNFVYRNDTLQYILTGEGRARPVPNPQELTKFQYDYFVKDHLGNVRSTVTAEPITAEYLARHEIATANVEQLVFDNIPNVRDALPNGTPENSMAARLDGGDPSRRVGTAMMLQVMPGDKFTISADAFYEGDYQQDEIAGPESVIESLMGALLNGNTYAGVPLSELPDNVRTITQALNNPALPGQLANLIQSSNNTNAPQSHLNVLFFNDKLELVEGNSSITQVPAVPAGGNMGGFVTITPVGPATGGSMQQVCCMSNGPGYILVYVDNQSVGKDVWFDNIMIEHYTGKIQEEHHYYPYGLTLRTDLQANAVPNSYLYNSKELEKSFDLNIYDYGARMQDMQLGRWFGIDPLAEKFKYESPYVYAGNNPIANVDVGGMLKLAYSRQDALDAGVNGEALRKFETIVKNVGNLLNGNPQLMEAMKNTTGWSEQQIKQQLNFGDGAEVRLAETGEPGSDASGMTLDYDMVKQLSMIDPSDRAAYGQQIFTVALFMLHELGHIGDKQLNGRNSGQYLVTDVKDQGRRIQSVKFDSETRSDAIRNGRQQWKISLTGHRGTDIELVGFGIRMAINDDGTSLIWKQGYPYYTEDAEPLPLIPEEIPQNAQFENIPSTLGL